MLRLAVISSFCALAMSLAAGATTHKLSAFKKVQVSQIQLEPLPRGN